MENLNKTIRIHQRKTSAVFNREKLDWMNGMYIRNMEEGAYCDLALAEMQKAGLDAGDPGLNRKIVLAVRNGLNRFGEIPLRAALFFADRISEYSPDAEEWIKKEASKRIFRSMLGALKKVKNLDNENFRVIMKQVQDESGVKGKDLWMPVRSALTGLTGGPELPVVIEILGKDKLIKFINLAMEV